MPPHGGPPCSRAFERSPRDSRPSPAAKPSTCFEFPGSPELWRARVVFFDLSFPWLPTPLARDLWGDRTRFVGALRRGCIDLRGPPLPPAHRPARPPPFFFSSLRVFFPR